METLCLRRRSDAAGVEDVGAVCLLGGEGDAAQDVSTIEMLIYVGSHSSRFRREAASVYGRGSPLRVPISPVEGSSDSLLRRIAFATAW